jgi:hypothetical protein
VTVRFAATVVHPVGATGWGGMQVVSVRLLGSQVPRMLAPLDEPPEDDPPLDEPPEDEPPLDDDPPLDEPPEDEPPLDELPDDVPPLLEAPLLLPLEVVPPLDELDDFPPLLEAPLLPPLDEPAPLEAPLLLLLLGEPPSEESDEELPHAPSRATAAPPHPNSLKTQPVFIMDLRETRPLAHQGAWGFAVPSVLRTSCSYMFVRDRLDGFIRVSLSNDCVRDGKILPAGTDGISPIRRRTRARPAHPATPRCQARARAIGKAGGSTGGERARTAVRRARAASTGQSPSTRRASTG